MNDHEVARDAVGDTNLQRLLQPGITGVLFMDFDCTWIGVQDGMWLVYNANGIHPLTDQSFQATYEKA
ncbi:hypothetical protein [Rhodococcoides fascians]|uniref:hypothetical protein n=1 Tax=Rhodococcoides fascians TaxID=1828 RepID=UPI00056AA4E2|nr:hypothetical protein [Rhodococcus fascians]